MVHYVVSPPHQPTGASDKPKPNFPCKKTLLNPAGSGDTKAGIVRFFGMSRARRFIPGTRIKSKILMRTLPPMSGKIASLPGTQMRHISKKTGNRAKL